MGIACRLLGAKVNLNPGVFCILCTIIASNPHGVWERDHSSAGQGPQHSAPDTPSRLFGGREGDVSDSDRHHSTASHSTFSIPLSTIQSPVASLPPFLYCLSTTLLPFHHISVRFSFGPLVVHSILQTLDPTTTHHLPHIPHLLPHPFPHRPLHHKGTAGEVRSDTISDKDRSSLRLIFRIVPVE
ncbi:hypothetical protein Pmani_036162 [Petrolisthes manimaculis]|uniref:Uncharacterized protein n=1 Tax=Petrolisthes manimaculis TaxID=1843537 RepID=A0AAE1NIX7_9EUCA|nr:hypothetical protein Pmani_036162 [Petrolisthes manimaculis]